MAAEISEFEEKKKKLIKKKRKTRVKRRFIVLLFLLVCVGSIFVVLKAPFFNVKTIVCIGQTELSQEEVIKIAGAKTNVNIFSTGVGTMKRRLAAHPGIAECNVRRLFPNKIKIWIRESKAVACVEQNGIVLLVDNQGQIIKSLNEKNKAASDGIARLVEFEPSSVKVGEYIFGEDDATHNVVFDCISILERIGMIQNVTQIDASNLSDIKIEYQDRLSVLIGSYEDMEYKLTFVNKVIDENLSKYEKAILDYRGSSLYVGPKNAEQPKPTTQEGEASPTDGAEEKKDTADDTKTTEDTQN